MEVMIFSFAIAFFLTWPFWKVDNQPKLQDTMVSLAKSDISKGRCTRNVMLNIAKEEVQNGNYEFLSVIRELQD